MHKNLTVIKTITFHQIEGKKGQTWLKCEATGRFLDPDHCGPGGPGARKELK